MKKIISAVAILVTTGCVAPKIQNNYKLEKIDGYEIPVCVNRPYKVKQVEPSRMDIDACGRQVVIPAKYEPIVDPCNAIKPEVVSYNYCLANMPKQVHLVEKTTKDGMTICYDRNNKVELPILYCQKDQINIQNTSVSQVVSQRTNVSQSQRMNIYY